MKGRAASLGKTIFISGIVEAALQLADFMTPGSPFEVVRMLCNWNAQAFDDVTGLHGTADFVHGHFYSYYDYHADENDRFRHLMTAGEVLRRTIVEKIRPHTDALPLWITEYHVIIQRDIDADGDQDIIESHLHDFQSGLHIANTLMAMIDMDLEGAHLWNLNAGNFGVMCNNGTVLRPAGLVFRLFSVMAGEERLAVTVDNDDTWTIVSGKGNVPTGLEYPLVSAVASKNAVTGRPRVFLLNRDYDSYVSFSL